MPVPWLVNSSSKTACCIYALEQGVQGVVIIDGKMQHAVLLELFTNQGTGTLIHK